MAGSRWLIGSLCAGMLLLPATSSAQPVPTARSAVSDTVVIATTAAGAAPSATSVQLARETFADAQVVLIARDDTFADALASGSLQDDGPLLLVPSAGPVPPEVLAQIDDLGAGRAVVLGGEAAVAPAVVTQLQQAGLSVERRAGGSRIETAAAIAADRPAATTAILARAFPADGASPTQAFADALAAGGLAAAEGLPILLTGTAALSTATRQHLEASAIEQIVIVGGTAAVSQAVEDEVRSLGLGVQRLAGAERAATAIEVAKARGADSADDVARLVLLDGGAEDAWVAGFAAASHSARLAAPIVLGTEQGVPPATEAWLAGGSAAVRGGPVDVTITCAIARAACERARVLRGLPPRAAVTYDPGGGVLPPGAPVTVAITGDAADVVAGGSCLDAPTPLAAGGGTVQRGAAAGPCTLTVELTLPTGARQVEQVDYAGQPAGPLLLAPGLCPGFRLPALSADGSTVAVLTDPAAGCEGISPNPAMAFIEVTDGSTTLLAMPAGWQRSTVRGVVILSPDGQVAMVDLEVPGDLASRTPWVFDRGSGQVRRLSDTDPSLAGSDRLITGGPQSWTGDGRVLGRYCSTTTCGHQAVDPLTGALSAPGDACWAWWNADPDGVLCDPGTTTAGGTTGLLFEGSRADGTKVEVGYDVTTGAVQVAPTPCEPTPSGAGWSVDGAGTTIHRACRTGRMGTAQMSLVVTPITGSGQIVATHTAPEAPLPLQAGIGDDRYVPLRYAIGDGETGQGVLHDLAAGAHVDLGTVRGVPQLHAPGSFVVVATDAGLERLPVVLGG